MSTAAAAANVDHRPAHTHPAEEESHSGAGCAVQAAVCQRRLAFLNLCTTLAGVVTSGFETLLLRLNWRPIDIRRRFGEHE